MPAIRANVEITEDGGLRLLSPLPEWVKPGVAEIVMVSQAAEIATPLEKPPRQKLVATPEMLEARKRAMAELRAMGGLSDVIPDPAAWQREIREDAVLPGRD